MVQEYNILFNPQKNGKSCRKTINPYQMPCSRLYTVHCRDVHGAHINHHHHHQTRAQSHIPISLCQSFQGISLENQEREHYFTDWVTW